MLSSKRVVFLLLMSRADIPRALGVKMRSAPSPSRCAECSAPSDLHRDVNDGRTYCRACWVDYYGSQPPPPDGGSSGGDGGGDGSHPPPQPCQFWRSTGRCKFGDSCRFLHGETLACATSVHPHTLGPGTSSGASRRKAYCDACGAKCKGGWQCTAGCDYVLCSACIDAHRAAGTGEAAAEHAAGGAACGTASQAEGGAASDAAAGGGGSAAAGGSEAVGGGDGAVVARCSARLCVHGVRCTAAQCRLHSAFYEVHRSPAEDAAATLETATLEALSLTAASPHEDEPPTSKLSRGERRRIGRQKAALYKAGLVQFC